MLQNFEKARAEALALAADLGRDALAEGFEVFLKQHNRFAYDYVRKHEGDLLNNLDHAMIRPIYHQFLARKLLPEKFHSFEAWRGE